MAVAIANPGVLLDALLKAGVPLMTPLALPLQAVAQLLQAALTNLLLWPSLLTSRRRGSPVLPRSRRGQSKMTIQERRSKRRRERC